ncbi:DUF4355 domain-containing protein [Megasphaera elsdenii]|uniref:DUF4355 domain-containing protein n=1 Tax=Megasphaera elsdenii TaxID=907 RepID=UPI0015C6C853|nr:DUF4355 domain-containing protein [Megasphaera elsdenii]
MADEFKFDLQRFADGGTEGGAADTTTGTENNGDGKTAPETSDSQTKENQEADVQQRIDDALAKAKARWEKEYQQKAAKAKKEAERLSKLSEEERAKEEQETMKKELEAKEKELNRKELKLEMVKVLSDRKIPVEFMDYLIADDNESTMDRIKTFDKQFKKAVEAAVNEKLKGKAPKAGGTGVGGNGGGSAKNSFFEAIYKNQAKR